MDSANLHCLKPTSRFKHGIAASFENVPCHVAHHLFIFDNQSLGFTPSSLGLPTSIDANVDRLMFPRFGVSGTAGIVAEWDGSSQPSADPAGY